VPNLSILAIIYLHSVTLRSIAAGKSVGQLHEKAMETIAAAEVQVHIIKEDDEFLCIRTREKNRREAEYWILRTLKWAQGVWVRHVEGLNSILN
jgi:hypothetical protein